MQKLIIFIEVGIKNQNNLQIKKLKQYDLLANELSLIYKCKVEIIPFVFSIPPKIQAYIQTIVLKKTLESISLNFKRGLQEECKKKDLSDITLMEKKNTTK
ncbi:hypothetical protein NUSPORA_00759 [Nucleospora cyclopteri]